MNRERVLNYNLPYLIGGALHRYGRIRVSDMKEKYGTYRVYCSFGFWGLHDIMFPRHHYVKFPKSLYFLAFGPEWLFRIVNFLVVPYQKLIYKLVYEHFIRKFPEERKALVYGMDYVELINKKYAEFAEVDECDF